MGPFRAIGQVFAMIFSFCAAGERMGKSLEHLAEIAEEEAVGLKDQMRVQREARQADLVSRLRKAA